MSGGFKDNEDMGETFVYTGEGGQEKEKQVCVHLHSQPLLVPLLCCVISICLAGGLAICLKPREHPSVAVGVCSCSSVQKRGVVLCLACAIL